MTGKEIWKDIKGYEGFYQVSNCGRVKSIRRNKIMKLRTTYKGYLDVLFSVNNMDKRYRVHRLVAQEFIPNLNNKPHINHIDGNKKNNNVNNLEWVTPKENNIHAIKNGLRKHKNINAYVTKYILEE